MKHEETESSFLVSKERKLTMPLAFMLALLASTACGVAAWTNTRSQVDRNTEDIKVLNLKIQTMQETMFEIRGDVKYLVRSRRGEESAK